MRSIRYQEIAAELRELASTSPAGSLLPSESELSARFGASRVTVRRALEVVREEGLIAARQGFGWFVATEPVRQRLEHLGTIEDQLEGGGRHAERRVVEFAFTAAPERVRRVLGAQQVLRVKRLTLADVRVHRRVMAQVSPVMGRLTAIEQRLTRIAFYWRNFWLFVAIPLFVAIVGGIIVALFLYILPETKAKSVPSDSPPQIAPTISPSPSSPDLTNPNPSPVTP